MRKPKIHMSPLNFSRRASLASLPERLRAPAAAVILEGKSRQATSIEYGIPCKSVSRAVDAVVTAVPYSLRDTIAKSPTQRREYLTPEELLESVKGHVFSAQTLEILKLVLVQGLRQTQVAAQFGISKQRVAALIKQVYKIHWQQMTT